MNITFVSPPPLAGGRFIEAEDCCWGAGSKRVLPAMLLACASEAQRIGHIVSFVDLSIDKPALAGDLIVYPLAWQYATETHAVMTKLCGRIPSVALAIPAGYAEHYARMTPAPFAVAYSEPEAVFGTLPLAKSELDNWRRGAAGLVWIDRNGDLHKSDYLGNCMANLGPVDYDLVPKRYWRHYHVLCYQATRGCPYRCGFCVWGGSTTTDRTFRMRPGVQVASDLRRMCALAGRQRVYLLASQLTTSSPWLRTFRNEMHDARIYFQSNVNLRDLDSNKLRLLRESGAISVSAGLEATSDRLLARLGKPYTMEQVIESIKCLVDSQISFRLHVRSGYGETADEVIEAIDGLHLIRAAVGPARLAMDLGPIIHYAGTEFETRDYRIIPHPNYTATCLYMADIPGAAWRQYVDVMRGYGWIAKDVVGK